MPFFFLFVWNHSYHFLVFTIRINFWDISWIYFFFFNIQNIKNNCRIFLKGFPIIHFWWIIYSFPVIFIYKRFNIWSYFCISPNFFITQCNSYRILKTFVNCVFRINYCFFFFISVENQYINQNLLLKVNLWHLLCISWTELKTKSLPLIDVSKLSWYLERIDHQQLHLHYYKMNILHCRSLNALHALLQYFFEKLS